MPIGVIYAYPQRRRRPCGAWGPAYPGRTPPPPAPPTEGRRTRGGAVAVAVL